MSERPKHLAERLKSGAKWSTAELLVSIPVRLGTLAVLARLVTPTEFGAFAAAVTVIEFARPLSTLSMDHALVQRKELSAGNLAAASWFSIGLSLLVGAVVVVGADAVSLIYDDPEVPTLLLQLAASLPVGAASALLLAVLRRELAFRPLSIIVVASSLVGAATSIAVAAAGGGVWALVTGYYADLLVKVFLGLILVRPSAVRPSLGNDSLGLFRFGAGTTLSVMLNFWALHGDYVVIGSKLGAKPLGYYSRAYQLISTVPGLLGHLHNAVLFPAFSRAQSDKRYLERALRLGTEATAATMLPLSVWGLVLGPEIIRLLLGPGWTEAVLPFQILSIGLYFRASYRFSAAIVLALGHVFRLSACQAIYGALIVGGAIYASRWGIVGVAGATVVALFVFNALVFGLTAVVSHGSPWSFFSVHARPLLLASIVLLISVPAKSALAGWTSSPLLIVVGTSFASGLVVAVLTRWFGESLWGTFLHEHGLATLSRGEPNADRP